MIKPGNIRSLLQRLRGASAVELAIAIPVFILLLGIIVDFSRIFAMYAAMNYAVHRAASDFAATPIEQATIDQAILNRYLARAENFMTSTFFSPPSVPSSARLVAFEQPGLPATTPRSTLFLRPSESAPYASGGGANFSHPISNGPGPLRPWATVLATTPFLVHAEADIRSIFLPGITRRLRVSAYAYRRSRNTLNVPGSGLGGSGSCPWCTPSPSPTPSPTLIPTPTPTPGGGGGPASPTPSPTPGATGTPTPTPCPCTNCCNPFVLGCCQGGN